MNEQEIHSTAETLYEQLKDEQCNPSAFTDELNNMCPEDRLAVAQQMDLLNEYDRQGNAGSGIPDLIIFTDDNNGRAPQLADICFDGFDLYDEPDEKEIEQEQSTSRESAKRGEDGQIIIDLGHGRRREEYPNDGRAVTFDGDRVIELQTREADGRHYSSLQYEDGEVVQFTETNRTGTKETWTKGSDGVWRTPESIETRHGKVDVEALSWGSFILKGDIDIESLFKANANPPSVLERSFAKLDLDGDGLLAAFEIRKAVTNPKITGPEALMISVLKKHYLTVWEAADIERHPIDGLKLEDISRAMNTNTDNGKKLKSQTNETINELKKALQGMTSRELFATDNPLQCIRPEACVQGNGFDGAGDCYFMSALASLAHVNPGAIKDMFLTQGVNEDGIRTYTIKFPGADKPVTVTEPTESELCLYGRGSKYGLWAVVLEKAYGKYESDKQGADKDDPVQEIIGHGSRWGAGLKVLTGTGVNDDWNSTAGMKGTGERLTAMLSDGHPVTAYVDPGKGTYGLEGGHELAILAYEPDPSGNDGTITIYNPLGSECTQKVRYPGDIEGDGVYKMKLSVFKKLFTGIRYSEYK